MSDIGRHVRALYEVVDALEAAYPGRKFTPDGHLVGSLGEAIAGDWYGLELYPPSHPLHDGQTPQGRRVQIKATQTKAIAFDPREGLPEHVLVLRIHRDGGAEEVYNGPAEPMWPELSKRKASKTGQVRIPLSALREVMKIVPPGDMLKRTDGGEGTDLV